MSVDNPGANATQSEQDVVDSMSDVVDSMSAEVQDLHDRIHELEELVKHRSGDAETSAPNRDGGRIASTKTAEINEKIESTLNKLSMIEALNVSDEFDKRFLASIRNELRESIIKIAFTAIVVMCGAGFFLIQHAVSEKFKAENATLIDSLRSSYADQFEKQELHNYGRHNVYLAEMYSESVVPEEIKAEKVAKLLEDAEDWFNQALDHGENRGSTLWELAELSYGFPEEHHLGEQDLNEAIRLYQRAKAEYSDSEIKRGWRGDVYRRLGDVYLKMWKDGEDNLEHLETSEQYYEKAVQDYEVPARDSKKIEDFMSQVNQKLDDIKKIKINSGR